MNACIGGRHRESSSQWIETEGVCGHGHCRHKQSYSKAQILWHWWGKRLSGSLSFTVTVLMMTLTITINIHQFNSLKERFMLTTTYASILPQMKFQDCVLLIMRHSTCKHLRHAVSQPLTPNSFSAIQSDAMSRNIAIVKVTPDSYHNLWALSW